MIRRFLTVGIGMIGRDRKIQTVDIGDPRDIQSKNVCASKLRRRVGLARIVFVGSRQHAVDLSDRCLPGIGNALHLFAVDVKSDLHVKANVLICQAVYYGNQTQIKASVGSIGITSLVSDQSRAFAHRSCAFGQKKCNGLGQRIGISIDP